MANLYVKAVPPADLNRNTDWFMYPGVWTTYILILFFSWLVLTTFGCSPGMAWTVVNLSHFLVCSLITQLCAIYMSFIWGFLVSVFDSILYVERFDLSIRIWIVFLISSGLRLTPIVVSIYRCLCFSFELIFFPLCCRSKSL